MTSTYIDLAMSLDGFIAGPNGGPANPLGDRGTRLHSWVYDLRSWRGTHGREGGRGGRDDDLVRELDERTGAYVMGRRMFDEGEANWPREAPFHSPVYVLTHHAREPWERPGGTTFHFVTEGIERAVAGARAAADGKDVRVAGGARVAQQALNAGLVDELQIHLAPMLLGAGVRLFDAVDPDDAERPALDIDRVLDSSGVTHLRYRVRPAVSPGTEG